MSLNPKLNEDLTPVIQQEKDEKIVFQNSQIEFQIKIDVDNPKSQFLKGTGKLYLTNMRALLVCKNQ